MHFIICTVVKHDPHCVGNVNQIVFNATLAPIQKDTSRDNRGVRRCIVFKVFIRWENVYYFFKLYTNRVVVSKRDWTQLGLGLLGFVESC